MTNDGRTRPSDEREWWDAAVTKEGAGTTIEQMRRRPLSGWACGHHSNSLHAALAEPPPPTRCPSSPTTDVTHCAASASHHLITCDGFSPPHRSDIGLAFGFVSLSFGDSGKRGIGKTGGKGIHDYDFSGALWFDYFTQLLVGSGHRTSVHSTTTTTTTTAS